MSSHGDNKDDSLTSHCSVCESPAAAHLHYGAVSCYSCRAFFRRGQPKQIRCIFGHGQCKISRHNRTNCKLCRYRKCIEVGMKPDKVDHYLNKRKEREARLAVADESPRSQEYEQIPNRSPASEEQTRVKPNSIQSSPRSLDISRKATPSPVNQRTSECIPPPPRRIDLNVAQNAMNSHAPKINDQERNNFREEYQQWMRHSQQGYFFPPIQNDYFGTMRTLNGPNSRPFHPPHSRPESTEVFWNKSENFTNTGPAPWGFGGIERSSQQARNADWDKGHTRESNLNNLSSTNGWNSWKSRNPPNMSSDMKPNFPNRPNQTSVIRYESNQGGIQYPIGRNQEIPQDKFEGQIPDYRRTKPEVYHPNQREYYPRQETEEIKQELSSSEDENPQMETQSSIIQYPKSKSPYFDYQSAERKFDKTSEQRYPQPNVAVTPFQPYASVIKRNIEASSQKPRLHTIANFRQVEIPKPEFTGHIISNCTNDSSEDMKEIKSEDIEADINEKFFDNSDLLFKTCNESFNDNFKIQIPKRKPNFSSDSEEEESPPAQQERSVVPLKKRQRMLEIPYATGHAVNKNVLPVMSFTFEEEFKVVDYIVRIEQYQNRRFEFVCKNFPQYKELTAAFVACTHVGRKIPFNRQLERKLFTIGLEFTKQSCKEIYEEMGMLSSDVRREVLNCTYPALYVVMWAILEGNTREKTWMDQHMKTLHITKENHSAIKDYIHGLENVRSISLKDQERFTSPWAVEMADEEKFERTVSLVGRLLRDDIQLQALYHMFVMMRPAAKNSDKIQADPGLAEVQIKLSQLIYRYLSTKSDFNYTKSGYSSEDSEGKRSSSRPVDASSSIMHMSEDVDDLNPDEKTRLLISLVDDLHDCVDIMQNRSLLVQAGVDV